ncbi:YeeE/YedE family protein [Acinetobacter sp. TY1]|uniref:YeeE/YedE family protein n=1 Tax=unclassified Acinetobacter TaxID=196816 RepID=UPI00306AABA6
MHDFLIAFLGGLLLGVAVIGYLFVNGRITGISGMVAQILSFKSLSQNPATWFILGLIVTPFIYGLFIQPDIIMSSNPWLLIIAGLLVGFGTRLGSGCTSGHGICGMSRLSVRSIVATCTFMLAGFITVYVMRHVLGAMS